MTNSQKFSATVRTAYDADTEERRTASRIPTSGGGSAGLATGDGATSAEFENVSFGGAALVVADAGALKTGHEIQIASGELAMAATVVHVHRLPGGTCRVGVRWREPASAGVKTLVRNVLANTV